jgi:tripartite-type tricarboxylate transporter receptor subunit TctC
MTKNKMQSRRNAMAFTTHRSHDFCPVVSMLAAVTLMSAALLPTQPALAQNYPVKPVRIIVPQSAGGSTDFAARAVAQKLGELLKENFIVDNRPGAGSINGTDAVAKAAPDGYTLLAVAASFTINPSLHKQLPFDPIRDFAPVTQMAGLPHLLIAHPSMPVKSVKDLIAVAKSKPGEINYASSGIATSTHLAAELFMYMTGTRMLNVPYKGGAPAMVAMLSGECQINFATISTALPHARAGRLRGIAVTSAKRSITAPEFPTIAESGVPGYEHNSWIGLLAPAKTPPAIVEKLNSETAKVVQLPEVKTLLLREGLESHGGSSREFEGIIKAEVAKWLKLTKAAGIKSQ